MRNVICTIWLLFFGSVLCGAQDLDNLKLQLPQSQSDFERMVLLGSIAEEYENVQQDSAIIYYEKALDLANRIEDDIRFCEYSISQSILYNQFQQFEKSDSILRIAEALLDENSSPEISAKIYMNRGIAQAGLDIDNDFEYLDKALDIAEENADLASIIPEVLIEKGGAYFRRGEVEKSSESILEAIEYFKADERWQNIAVSYLNLAINNLGLKDYDRALEHGEQGLKYAELSEVEVYKAHANMVLTAANSELGNHEKAVQYGEEALTLWTNLGSSYQVAMSQRFVGKAKKEMSNVDESISHLEEAVNAFETLDDPTQILFSLLELSHAYALVGQKRKSQELVSRAEEKFAEAKEYTFSEFELYKLFEETYIENENFEKAYLYRNKHDVLKDSIFKEDRLAKYAELETEFEVKEKDAALKIQEAQLSRQKTVTWAIGMISGLLLIISFLIYRNLQSRKRLNQELIKLDETKSRFFANLSHELRTPLTLIIGPLEKALSQTKTGSAQSRDISTALTNSNQLLSLVNEIMDLSKLENSKLELQKSHVDLYKLTERIFSAFESMAEIKKVHMRFNYELDKNLTAYIDIPKYEKILNNLISNAIKFTPSDGEVELSVRKSNDERVEVLVRDSGKGIDADEISKIFDRYYQVKEFEEVKGGTGIGLALSKELTTLHGGELTVESELGKGSTFKVLIPLELEESKIKASLVSSEEEGKSTYEPILALGERKNILVIDDHESMRGYLKDILDPFFNVSFAVDGKDALEKLATGSYDAITCDVMMPRMNGFEFLKSVRSGEMKTHIPIVLLTARNLEEDKLKGLSLGTDDYITKPFNAKELVARLQNLISQKVARDESSSVDVKEVENIHDQTLKKVESLILSNIENSSYDVSDLAQDMHYSNRQLSRILKKLSGLSTNQFIREIKLRKAYQLIKSRQYATISEVRHAVGIPHASYFTKEFERRFGLKPSEVSPY